MTGTTKVPGRGWAYTGVVLGGGVSIAANITHTFVPPPGHPAGWSPEPMAVVFAMSWPVFLFVAVEILARTPWPRLWNWTLLRWLGLTPVALVAAFVSYRHLSGLLAHYGEEPLAALTGPLAVDGLMVVATGALLATGRHRTSTLTPTVGPVAGIAAQTVSTPIPVAAPGAPQGAPATPTPSPVDTPPAPPVPAAPAPVVPTPAVVAQRITPPRPATPATPAAAARSGTRTTRTRLNKPATTPTVSRAPSTIDTPVTASDAAQLTLPVVPPDLLARAAKVARDYRTEHGTPITAGQLAVRLKVTSDTATQALAVLDLSPDSPTTPISTVNGSPIKETR